MTIRTIGKFRNRIQRRLVLDTITERNERTQENFDNYKLEAIKERSTNYGHGGNVKASIIYELMKTPETYGLSNLDIADIPNIPLRLPRSLSHGDFFKVGQLAEFNGGLSNELLRYRNFGKITGQEAEMFIFQPYKVPYLCKLTEGVAAMGVSMSKIPTRVLDALVSSRLSILDLVSSRFSTTREASDQASEVRSRLAGRRSYSEEVDVGRRLFKHIQEIPFGNGEYVLVHRDETKRFY